MSNDQPESPESETDLGGQAAAQEEPTDLTPDERADLVEAEPAPSTITYSGQDFDVNGLVRRLVQDDILIPIFGHNDHRIASAGFQRSFVWNRPQMDRFIESLLLGYPIPGIFLVRQADRRYLVLDGQQRLRTLQYFYEGLYQGKEFALHNVGQALVGATYKNLDGEQRRLLDDAFIQATIVSTDGTPASLEAIYQLFERLNAGGTQLTPHEIRVALFAGPFIDLLERLNQGEAWRALYGKVSPRLRDQELVLRIVALCTRSSSYRRPLKTFLNGVVADHRTLEDLDVTTLSERFAGAAELLVKHGGREALRRQGAQLNAALTEAIFVGLMRRLDSGQEISAEDLKRAVQAIQSDSRMEAVVSKATADEESVRVRLEIATSEFAPA